MSDLSEPQMGESLPKKNKYPFPIIGPYHEPSPNETETPMIHTLLSNAEFKRQNLDYGTGHLHDLIDACNFTYINTQIPRLYHKEIVRGEMGTMKLEDTEWTDTETVLWRMKEMGVEPMNATELFTFCQGNWDTFNKGWIMALGSVTEFGGAARSPGVFRYGKEHRTTMGWLDQVWHDCYIFGYVHNTV